MTDDNQDNTALALAIGKVEGQLRELIHTSNNNSQKLDTLNDTVLKAADLPEQVRKLSARVEVLETERHQRTGAFNILGTVAKSPAIGWLTGAAITIYVLLTGRNA